MNRIFQNFQNMLTETCNFLTDPEQISRFMMRAVSIIIILVIARIGIKIMESVINRFFLSQQKNRSERDLPRMQTIKELIVRIARYIIYFIAVTSIIESFGVQIGAIIATAGIGGIALGFGAQSLVKDIISGAFILYEDQFTVGNYIQLGDVEGIVEEMTLRTTKLRDFSGNYHIIPNGEIKKVTNKSVGSMRAKIEIDIAYEESIDNAIRVLNETGKKLRAESPSIVEGPTVLGVSNIGDSKVVITVVAQTHPMEQWAVERLMRKAFKEAFDKENIETPYQRRATISEAEEAERK